MADRGLPRTLVIMVKAPVAGAVKTRLAHRIGTVEALRFYRVTTASVLRRLAADRRWRTVLAVSPDSCTAAGFWPSRIPRIGQGRGDLGRRMQRLFDRPGRGPVVIVGSDIPDIRADHIARAFALLGDRDAVFGPAEDGGYWLIGLRRRPRVPRPFACVRWSTAHALADTLANLDGPAALLPTLADVDTEEDWRRWRAGAAARGSGAAGGMRRNRTGPLRNWLTSVDP